MRAVWCGIVRLIIVLALCGCGDSDDSGGSLSVIPGGDWVRTEAREPCTEFVRTRQPFFGELHIHTAYSADAGLAGTLALPREAYDFAKGAEIAVPPFDRDGGSRRVARLGRPLDFAAVTDHSESFGAEGDRSLADCVRGGMIVDDSECDASMVWSDTQAAAEEHYDRSAECSFTTFVAYEWSLRARRASFHRNVIFRNAEVPPLAKTSDQQTTPEALWDSLDEECLSADGACDVLTIPHSANLSRGLMFAPETLAGEGFAAQSAARRAAFEPIVEIMQSKGDSECRVGIDTNDELCGFEKINRTGSSRQPFDPDQEFQRLSFVRNALKDGLLHGQRLGVNPFALGVIAASDGHTAAPGSVREADFPIAGNFGLADSSPEQLLSVDPPGGIETNGGGLAVLWAEENSRDALFSALRRREVYGTSGPRMVVRFFAGDYEPDLCDQPDLVDQGYRHGVPMGGDLDPARLRQGIDFVVHALRDPGTVDFPGTPLQRVQIVKGWVDAEGVAHERVYEVAGDPDNGATVDPETCVAQGRGFDSLCAVWTDPDFDADQPAFYYARVVENPTCRWHSFVCNEVGARCGEPSTVPDEFATCCDPFFPRAIQERAWTSPVFYSPAS